MIDIKNVLRIINIFRAFHIYLKLKIFEKKYLNIEWIGQL